MTTEEKRKEIEKYCLSLGNTTCGDCPLQGRSKNCYTGIPENEVEENYKTLVENGCLKNLKNKNTDKHFNSYVFDSSMYRYMLARERQLMWEITKENSNSETARHRYARDVMKFREILEEVMGEHD